MRIRICILLVLAGLAAACGKSAIGEAQQFVPNKAPVITEFSVELTLPSGVKQKVGYWDGAAHPAPANSLTIGQAPVTVRASDPEGRELRYSFTLQGADGTVAVFSTADGLCTATVDLDVFTESTDVQLAVRVNDDRKGAAAQTINLGTGLTSPVVTADDAGAGFLRSAASKQVTITATSTGYYQLIQVPANADGSAPAAPAFDNLKPFYYYETIGGERTLTIAGPTCADAADVRLVGGEGRYYVYIIFRDPNLQAGSLAIPSGLDDTPPVLALGAGSDRVGSLEPITVSATDALSGVDGSSIAVDKSRSSALPPTAGRTAAGAFADGLITIMPSHYWVYGVAAWGNQRNLTVIAKDEAGNTAEQRLDMDIYPQRIYIRNDAAAADGTWKVGPADNPYPNDSVSLRDAFSQAQVYLATGESCEIWLEANDATNPQYTFSGTSLPSFDGGGTKSLALFGSCINTGGVWSRGAVYVKNGSRLVFTGVTDSAGLPLDPKSIISIVNAASAQVSNAEFLFTCNPGGYKFFAMLYFGASDAVVRDASVVGCIGYGASNPNRVYGVFVKNSSLKITRSAITASAVSGGSAFEQVAIGADITTGTADREIWVDSSLIMPHAASIATTAMERGLYALRQSEYTGKFAVRVLNNTFIFKGPDAYTFEGLSVSSVGASGLEISAVNNIMYSASATSASSYRIFLNVIDMPFSSSSSWRIAGNCLPDASDKYGHYGFKEGASSRYALWKSIDSSGAFELFDAGTSVMYPSVLGIANADVVPVFVNAPAGNYALDQSSPFPVLAGGADLSAEGITVDYNGKPRTAGDGWSMGAFEY